MALSPQERGRLGNRAAIEKNPQHQSEAGKSGIRALAARYFGGSIDEAMAFLRRRSHEAAIEALAGERLKAELAAGAAIASIELPADEEYEPESWVTRVTSQGRSRSRAG